MAKLFLSDGASIYVQLLLNFPHEKYGFKKLLIFCDTDIKWNYEFCSTGMST